MGECISCQAVTVAKHNGRLEELCRELASQVDRASRPLLARVAELEQALERANLQIGVLQARKV